MSTAQFIKDKTCPAHYSMISSGKYPPVTGSCLICENQALQTRLEPFLEQELKARVLVRRAANYQADANKKAASEAEDAQRAHQEVLAGSVETTPIAPPSNIEPSDIDPRLTPVATETQPDVAPSDPAEHADVPEHDADSARSSDRSGPRSN